MGWKFNRLCKGCLNQHGEKCPQITVQRTVAVDHRAEESSPWVTLKSVLSPHDQEHGFVRSSDCANNPQYGISIVSSQDVALHSRSRTEEGDGTILLP